MKLTAFLLILISFLPTPVSGQKNNKKIVVSGLVTNVRQKPIVGAIVLIDGKNTNRTTNNNGIYKVKVRPDADSITIVTFTNEISTVAINGRTNIDFILSGLALTQQDAQKKQSNDQKVNIGYGSVDRKSLTTPVTSVDARNNKYASYRDIYEILRELPGVIVSGNSVRIQGVASISSGTQPLFVVDGTPVGTIDQISPATVANISVLKGASTAVYGSRGANGVILITLIKGLDRE
jgi:TonB-dependent SusC/RagA subfamily outer membrane receptor